MRKAAAKKILFICLLIYIPAAGFAQSVEPEDPGIVLPEIVLELESLPEDEVQTLVPDDVELYAPDLDPELPEADDLQVDDDLLEVPLLEEESSTALASSFYIEGILGLGIQSHFLGDFSLYKFGADPRFNLRVIHETIDGFQNGEAGLGFFRRDDLFNLQFSYKKDQFKIEADLHYAEQENGFQNQSPFYSVIQRSYVMDLGLTLVTSGIFEFLVNGDMTYLNIDLTGGANGSGHEIAALPGIGIKLTGESSYLNADLVYDLYRVINGSGNEDSDGIRFRVDAGYEFSGGFQIGAAVGLNWIFNTDPVVPFIVTLGGSIGEVLTFALNGGYYNDYVSFSLLLTENPYLSFGGDLLPEHGWYAELDTMFRVSNGLRAGVLAEFRYAVNKTTANYSVMDAGTGLYGFSIMNGTLLDIGLKFEWKVNDIFKLLINLNSQLLADKDPDRGVHSLDVTGSIKSNDSKLGADISVLLEIYDTVQLPVLEVNAFYEISEGIKIVLSGEDVLAPLISGGRTKYGVYIEPGLLVTLSTNISF